MCVCLRVVGVCLYVFKRRCRWQEVPEVPAVYHALLKVGGSGGVPEVRAGTVALATACKIASSALPVTVGFCSRGCSLLRSALRDTSGTSEGRTHQKTKLGSVLLILLFSSLSLSCAGLRARVHGCV